MRQFRPEHWQRGRLALERDAISYFCSQCGKPQEPYASCTDCAGGSQPVARCQRCGDDLREERVEYSATGKRKGTVTRQIDVLTCDRCHVSAASDYWTRQIEALAEKVSEDLRFLPEIGIYSTSLLEVLADSATGDPSEVAVHEAGMELRSGDPSDLFAGALNMITEYDTEDYGHSMSSTLQVRPGPPYDLAQRRLLHLLLARLQADMGSPLALWSTHFRIEPEGERAERDRRVARLLAAWPADEDRAALALHNDLLAGKAPGRFITAFRLLELVLHRLIDDDVVAKRHDTSISDDAFRELVLTHGQDLKTRLRRRIESMRDKPAQPLRGLWRAAAPQRGFQEAEVYSCIATFRNRYAHQPQASDELALPWELPDFDAFVDHLIDLVAAMLGEHVAQS